ncbi:MAG: Sensor kinase CckA [Syntrophus sp. SKADARSKE-3]|nr:Sensor kinase CckA [Syntrophus sp. SKADARSKE-3]
MPFYKLLETFPQCFFETDVDGKCIFANEASCKKFGYNKEEFLERKVKFFDLIVDSDRQRMIGMFRNILDGSFSEGTSYTAKTVSGKEIPIACYASSVCSDENVITGIRGFFVDMMEQKDIEDSFSRAFYATPLPTIICSMSTGKCVEANKAFLSLTGYDLNNVLGRLAVRLPIWTDMGITNANARELLEKGYLEERDVSLRTKDGKTRHVLASAEKIYYKGEQAFILLFYDITARRELEEVLVRDRKMEAIGTLASGIVHDFNNLLTGIQAHASLIKTRLYPGHILKNDAVAIEAYVANGAALTRQLLEFANGGKPGDIGAVNPNHLLQHYSDLFTRINKDIKIQFEMQTQPWSMIVDQWHVGQVIINLFTNAKDAMPAGGTIYVKTENVYVSGVGLKYQSLNEGPHVKITVRDNGCGMPPDVASRIFDPFFTTKKTGNVRGMGLASVYGIVRKHKGSITVDSVVGKGTMFHIWFPASENVIEVDFKKEADTIIQGNGTILVIDDEENIRSACAELLALIGYDALTAGDGIEGVKVYTKNKEIIVCVILDMIMPGRMRGKDVFHALREIAPSIPILLCSGTNAGKDAKDLLQYRNVAFLQKPYTIERLSEDVSNLLRKAQIDNRESSTDDNADRRISAKA